jgi:hypothetical protein
MQTRIETPRVEYEFDDTQNNTFRSLASMLRFVGITMFLPGVILILPALGLGFYVLGRHMTERDTAYLIVLGVPGALMVTMGFHMYRAASHFRNIATTTGHDIANLMTAIKELIGVYEIQRWLWIVIGFLLIIGYLQIG